MRKAWAWVTGLVAAVVLFFAFRIGGRRKRFPKRSTLEKVEQDIATAKAKRQELVAKIGAVDPAIRLLDEKIKSVDDKIAEVRGSAADLTEEQIRAEFRKLGY